MKHIIKDIIPSILKDKIRYLRSKDMYKKESYSQSGEDIIINHILKKIHGDRKKKYLDIGAHHPFLFSNTALLYLQGGSGILVEPDPILIKSLKKHRPRDIILECGVHFSGEKNADFFIISPPTLNTFSPVEMKNAIDMGHKLVKTINVQLNDINSILESSGQLDLMSIDVEGLDESILKMVNWDIYRPTCICIETLNYSIENQEKSTGILQLMKSAGYFLYADTYINSIFVDQRKI